MRTSTNSRYGFLISCAAHGAAAWTVFGVAEYFISGVAPLFTDHATTITTLYWKWTAALFGVYLGAGGVLGIISGLLFQAVLRGRGSADGAAAQAVGSLSVAAVFTAHLFVRYPQTIGRWPALLICAAVVAALTAVAGFPRWQVPFSFLAYPWTMCVILVATPWLDLDLLGSLGPPLRLAASIAIVAGTLAAAVLGRLGVRWSAPPPIPARTMTSVVAAAVLLTALAAAANRHLSGVVHRPAPSILRERPNILLIAMDTVRADRMSLYGYARQTTPNLTKLAAEATLYRNAMAAGDMTLPGHGSMFSGLYPRRHGAHLDPAAAVGRPLAAGVPTLAELLASQGYSTWAIVANHAYVSPEYGFHRGFQLFDRRRPAWIGPQGWYLRQAFRPLLAAFTTVLDFDIRTRRAGEITEDAMSITNAAAQAGERFFLFLNYMDAHSPYVPPAPFDRMFAESANASVDEASRYDGGIAYVDAEVGRLMAHLKTLGLYDEMLIVITSDHGEELGERGNVGHGGLSVYQELLHVPLLIKYPQSSRPERVESFVSHVDIMPTVLEVARVAPPPNLDGRSLIAAGDERRWLLSESHPLKYRAAANPHLNRVERAIVAHNFKLIVSTKGKRELYDLARDPREINNLYRPDHPIAVNLQKTLDDWLKATRPDSSAPKAIDSQMLQRLKSLGYAQ